MEAEWVNLRTERNPNMAHVHEDGSQHETETTIPMLSVDGVRPRHYTHFFVCKDCRERLERQVPA